MSAEQGYEDDWGVAHINQHGVDHFGGILECAWTDLKGRVVRATRSWAPGEVILEEAPLHIVQEDMNCPAFKRLVELCGGEHGYAFDYEALWYWCAIQSLTKEELAAAKAEGCTGASLETQRNLLLLHHEEVSEPSKASEILKSELVPCADAYTIERLTQIWVLNCFEYSDQPQGYSTYFFSSFMSHSCFPNAVWHYTGTDHVLRARREIKEGDEVCISYLPESGLLNTAPSRRMELNETKRFWCDCERCGPGLLDHSRGLRCPRCAEGQVFAGTPEAGPAEDASLLVSQLVGAVCSDCRHVVSTGQAQILAGHEKELQAIVEKYEKRNTLSVQELQADEAFIDKHFSQHALADHAWVLCVAQYAAHRRTDDQRRLLKRHCEFNKAAYPGISGAYAWAHEALGDCLRRTPKPTTEDMLANGEKKRQYVLAAKEDVKAAKACYAEASEILQLMFGPGHEYAADVASKLQALEARG